MLAAADESMPGPTPLEEYLFDLRGYSVLPNALPAEDVTAINDWIDDLDLESRPIGDWEGDVEIHSYCARFWLCILRAEAALRTSRHADWTLWHILPHTNALAQTNAPVISMAARPIDYKPL